VQRPVDENLNHGSCRYGKFRPFLVAKVGVFSTVELNNPRLETGGDFFEGAIGGLKFETKNSVLKMVY
jgi:hypothetical protein